MAPADTSGSPRLSRQGLPRAVLALAERLAEGGYRAWVVGGSVRDSLLAQLSGQAPQAVWSAKDWDLATDATPEQVMPLFRKVIPTGVEHGTVTVLLQGLALEVTTLRADRSYRDGRRPEQIEFVTSIEEDLARRDFTVNAIAFAPEEERLIDPFGGVADLRARRLRAVGEPARRFAEDGLRVLRAARLVATLEFELEPETARAIRPSLDTYRRVSAERIRDEWVKALGARQPSRAFSVMHEHGLLAITAPELERLDGQQLRLALSRMDHCPRDPQLRLAALLCELDADPSRAAALVEDLMTRLRCSNAERKRVTHLVRQRLPPRAELASPASLRRWLRRIGPEQHPDASTLERAHLLASDAPPAELEALERLDARVRQELAAAPPLSLSALAIDGRRLMQEAGVPPGPLVGRTLEALLERVLDEPADNTSERLLAIARALRGSPAPDGAA